MKNHNCPYYNRPVKKENILWSITKGSIKFTLNTIKVLFIGSVVLIGSCGFIAGGCSSMVRGCSRIVVNHENINEKPYENKEKIKEIEKKVSINKVKKKRLVL